MKVYLDTAKMESANGGDMDMDLTVYRTSRKGSEDFDANASTMVQIIKQQHLYIYTEPMTDADREEER